MSSIVEVLETKRAPGYVLTLAKLEDGRYSLSVYNTRCERGSVYVDASRSGLREMMIEKWSNLR